MKAAQIDNEIITITVDWMLGKMRVKYGEFWLEGFNDLIKQDRLRFTASANNPGTSFKLE